MTATSFLPTPERLYNNNLHIANDITTTATNSFNDTLSSDQLLVLSLWINFKLEGQITNNNNDYCNIKNEYIVDLVNSLYPGSIILNDKNRIGYIDSKNNDSTSTTQQNDHLSYVAQILNILLEQNDGHIVHPTLVHRLEHAIIDNQIEIIFKFISWIALKLYLNNILLDDNIKSYAFQLKDDFNQITIQPTIPKFQLYDLSFQHIFLDIRKYLLIWVNWQFKSCTSDISNNFVSIFDFGNSWKNGLAFALLIYCSNKSLLSDDLLTWIQQIISNKQVDEWWTFKDDDKTSATILSNVFNTAKMHMNIPNYLQPQHLLDVSYPNELCIVLYIYEFYQLHLKNSTKITKSDLDLKKILDAVEKASHIVNSNNNNNNNEDNNNTVIPLHPLDHPNDDSVSLYIQKVAEAQSLWEILKSQNVNMDPTSINRMKIKYDSFILGIDYVKVSDAVKYELHLIIDIMKSNDNNINDAIFQQLITKIDVVKSSIYGLKDAFSTLLVMERYDDHFQEIKKQYELVNSWVDQVIKWKTEFKNIKTSVNEWIDLIKQRNAETDKFDINALEINDISVFNDVNIMEIHTEHEQLKKDIKDCENDKMKHFYDYIQKQTNTQQQHYSTPADTITTIIVSTTINEFNNLFQYVNERSFWVDCLVDRLKWEHIFDKSVKWIALMDSHIDYFFRHQALWCQQDNDFDILDTSEDKEHSILSTYINKENAEKIIITLVEIEQSISNFDNGSFSEVLSAYQEMKSHVIDNTNKDKHSLLQILEQRQNGFELAFDDLMKRCTLARKVVEQKLVMMDVATQFKDIKLTGETLRRKLLVANDGLNDIIMGPSFSDSSNHYHSEYENTSNEMDEVDNNHKNSSNSIEDSVQSFKEASADFITHIKSRVPLPEIPIMATAMGSTDAQDVTTTNDAIKSTIHTCGMALALLADGLEQLLMERQHIHSLQRRAKYTCEQLSRFTDWMGDKKQLLIKTDFDIYKYIGKDEQDGDFTVHAVDDKNEEVLNLEKERDNIASRLEQIEQEDLEKLIENVNHLESDIDEANAVSVDRHAIVDAIEKLESAKLELSNMLIERSNKLESLKKYLIWKSHWIKTNQWTLTTTRKLWDFCMKRARFDLQVEDTNKPSNDHERELTATLQSYQERVNDASEKQIKNLSDLYTIMVDEMNKWELGSDSQLFKDQIVIDFTSKQSILIQKYRSLVLLLQYASKLINQRSLVIFTLQQFHESNREGERIRDHIIKATRRITDYDAEYVNNSQSQPHNQQNNVHQRVEQFKANMNELWNKHVECIIYPMYSPKCNDQSYCSIFSSTQVQQKQQADINLLLKNKMDQLKKLDLTFSELLESYDRISKRKELVMEYSMNALDLDQWIQDQILNLKKRHIDVSLETNDILNERSWNDLDQQHKKLIAMMDSFEKDKLQPLHSKISLLVDEELRIKQQQQQQKQSTLQNLQRKSMDVTIPATQHLGNVINSFSTLKHEAKDETIYLNAFAKRIKWTEALQDALSKLEIMQNSLIEWSKHKDEWVELEIESYNDHDDQEIEEKMLKNLVDELESIIIDKDNFILTVLPNVCELYDTFIECFSNLPRPMATPDHIEVTMNSLIRSKKRFQESLNSKTKELDILQECRRWDSKWKLLCNDTTNNNKAVESFVTNRARWNNKIPNDDDQFFNQLMKDTQELQHRCFIQNRVDELKDQLDHVTGDILMNNMSDSISKRLSLKFTKLNSLSCFASKLSSFLDMVIDQNGLVRGLCIQLNQLENDLITALDMYNSSSSNRSGENNKHNNGPSIIDQYRQFNKNIRLLQISIDKVVYPVRPIAADNGVNYRNENVNIDSNNNRSDLNVDILANDLIKNTLNNGIIRLHQSLSEFGSLLAHEKKVLQDEYYQDYSEKLSSVKEWINTQIVKINDIKIMLENVTTQLFIDENNNTIKDIPTEKYFSILNNTSSSVGDIQSLLQSNQHLITELTASKCKWMDLLDENINLIEHSSSSESQIVENTYKETLSEWSNLQNTTENLNDQVQNRYLPSLLDCVLLQLSKNINLLETKMNDQHYSHISDDYLNEWSIQLNCAQKEYNFIYNQFDINTESTMKSINRVEKDLHHLNLMYRNIDKNSKDWNKAQKQQWETEQFIKKVTNIIQESILLCENVSKADLSNGEEKIKTSQIQWSNQHKNIKESMQQLEINYHEILSSLLITSSKNSSSYTLDEFILNHQQELKSQIDKSWLDLHHHTASIVRNTNILNKWIKLYTELKDARQVFLGCKTTLETMMLQKPNIINGKDDFQSSQSAIVENIDRQLKTTLPGIKNLIENIDSNLTNDHYHHQSFMEYYQNSIELGNHVKSLLDDYHKTKVCRTLYNQYQHIIDQRIKMFTKQLAALKKYNKHYQDIYDNYKQLNDQWSKVSTNTDMRKILNSNLTDIEHVQDAIIECKEDLDDSGEIGNLFNLLINNHNQNHESLIKEQKELFKIMDELSSLINWQQKWHQFISMVDTHIISHINLLEDVHQLYDYFSSLQVISNTDIEDDLQQYKILEETLSTFVTFEDHHSQQRNNFDFTCYSLYHEQHNLWLELMNKYDKKISGKWEICTEIYNNIQNMLTKNRQQQQNVAKLDGTIRKLNDIKIRVDSLRLSGQNIAVEHQELMDINNEFMMITESNLETICKQQELYNSDPSIQQRYVELDKLKDTINHTILEKQNKAKGQEKAVQLMEDIKRLENITDLIDSLIESVAPHHAGMENGTFNKSDLQELLKKFIKEFKHHAQSIDRIYKKIEEKLKTAKDEENKPAIDLLTSWKYHWKNTKATARVREEELQACIQQLQHDFFTKLALVNKNKKIEKQFLQQFPLNNSSSTTTTLYSYENRNRNQNELDIQVKRTIKDQASKLKICTVPGHVGKYWFGNSNKRLVYCRILQSNMVMVRVGGGWVELSKFLLEHGCKEGVMLPDKKVNKNSKFTETYLMVERSISPSGRVTIRGGGGGDMNSNGDVNIFNHTLSGTSSKTSISTRCKSPPAGYMDGDRFIRIDESGNQLAIKMTRADDDSFIPYHPNNKTLYQW
ncbi:unnamed protein product [Cunninghamella blakesleeana]